MPVDTFRVRAAALTTLIAPMWLVRFLDMVTPGNGSVAGHGIVPRTWYGLEGIPLAPFIHVSVEHLLANTAPLLILGALVVMRGVGELVFVVVTSGLIGGLGTWMFGAGDSQHVGASGVVFGLFGYLLFRTAFDRRWSSAVIALVVAVGYGTMMMSSLIPHESISWSGHFFGFLGGLAAARMRYARYVPRAA